MRKQKDVWGEKERRRLWGDFGKWKNRKSVMETNSFPLVFESIHRLHQYK